MSAQLPFIRFDKVEVSYNEFVAGLRGISFDIHQGEFVYLCGQTGSGKSTILKVLSKQLEPTKGTVLIAGKDLSTVKPDEIPLFRRQMGIVPQDFGLLSTKKVWENVAYAMRAVGRTKREVRKLVPEILERVNILHRADAYPGELSGGEQQRVAIARSLINNPPLLLADEPTGNLDPAHSQEIIELLRELNDKGTTVVVATHDMMIVESTSKRVIKLAFGRIDTELAETDEPHSQDSSPISEHHADNNTGQQSPLKEATNDQTPSVTTDSDSNNA